jgi:hypothetical protein
MKDKTGMLYYFPSRTHPLEGAILVLEVENRRPIIRKVLAVSASRASGQRWKVIVGVHSYVKASRV